MSNPANYTLNIANQILNLANQGASFINYTAHGYEQGWADPSFDNTERFVAYDGASWYTGKVGVKGENMFLKSPFARIPFGMWIVLAKVFYCVISLGKFSMDKYPLSFKFLLKKWSSMISFFPFLKIIL